MGFSWHGARQTLFLSLNPSSAASTLSASVRCPCHQCPTQPLHSAMNAVIRASLAGSFSRCRFTIEPLTGQRDEPRADTCLQKRAHNRLTPLSPPRGVAARLHRVWPQFPPSITTHGLLHTCNTIYSLCPCHIGIDTDPERLPNKRINETQ